MNRSRIERAAERLATERGYLFRPLGQGAEPAVAGARPTALLPPVELRSVEGRRHGRADYGIVMHLVRPAAKCPPEGRGEVFAALERDMLAIFAALSEEECVLAVEELEIGPSAFVRTLHGELAQTARARIVTWF